MIGKHPLFRLGKDTLVYGVTSAVTAGIYLLVVIFATRLVTPEQYGTIEIFRSMLQFLGIVIVMGMDMAQSYFYFRAEPHGPWSRASLSGALVQFRILWGLLIVVVAAVLMPVIFKKCGISWQPNSVHLTWVMVWCWSTHTSLIFLTHSRLTAHPFQFARFSIFQTLLACLFSVIGMIWWPDKITAYLAGFGLASVLVLAFQWLCLRGEFSLWPLQVQWWGKLGRFGAPFLLSAPLIFGLQMADRWFIMRRLGASELGIYAVGAQFAAITTGMTAVFLAAWEPMAMEKLHQFDGPDFFRSSARLYLGGFSAVVVLLTLFLPFMVKGFAAESYHRAQPIACILLWPPVLYGFFYLVLGGVWKNQKIFWFPVLTGCGLAINVTANLVMVNRLGIVGAACATTLAFLVLSVMGLVLSEKLWKIHLPSHVFVAQIGSSMTVSSLILFLENKAVAFLVRFVVALAGLILVLWITLGNKNKKAFGYNDAV